MRDFVPPDDDILSRPSKLVAVSSMLSDKTQAAVRHMLRIAQGQQGDARRKTMVGLAAPQIGIDARIIIVDVRATGDGSAPQFRVYINPVIVQRSEKTEEGREGCYSTHNVCGIVERAHSVTVEGYNRDGVAITETYTGFPARIIQHEIDHLNGIRFPDLITDLYKLHWVEPAEFGRYREEWATWNIRCSRRRWQKIKGDTNA